MTPAPVPGPPEELMTEHGLLNRCLLIYKTALARPRRDFPAPQVQAAAAVVRTLIHDDHEEMEEAYIFPVLTKAGELASTCAVLLAQHHAGKKLTDRILSATAGQVGLVSVGVVSEAMRSFITMYEPHEAREDTVIFPAWRALVSAKEFVQTAAEMEEQEDALLGSDSFGDALKVVEAAEEQLGIFDLARFTPTAPRSAS